MKNGVSSDPNAFTCSATPASRAASARPGGEPRAERREARVELRRELVEAPESGGHRQRIARQRARLIHRTGRRDELHQIRAAAVGADRQPAADDLAEAGQIRLDAGRAPARRPATARNPEITSSKISSAPAAAQTSRSARRKPSAGGTTPMLPAIGSTITRGDVVRGSRRTAAAPTRGRCSWRRSVSADGRARDAGAGRHAERQRARAGLHQERVGVPVIAAFELDDLVAPVAARATRTALIAASVPELTKRTRSSDGISRCTRSPSSTSSGLGAPKLVPCFAAAASALGRGRAARGRG